MPAESLRVSVLGGDRRADLVVPATLAVAELVPLLAEHLAVGADPLRPARLARVDGRLLDPERTLAAQGVVDGAVLDLRPDPPVAPRHDDLAEALGEVLASHEPGWGAGHRRACLRTSALLAGLLSAGALLAHPDPPTAGLLGAAGAAALLGLAAHAARTGRDGPAPRGGTALLACALACLLATGGVLAWVRDPSDATLTGQLARAGPATGAALVVTALGGAALLRPGRALLLAPAVPGAALVVVGLLARVPVPPVTVLAVLVTATVLLGAAVPAVALGVLARGAPDVRDPYGSRPDGPDGPDGPGPEGVAACAVDTVALDRDARLAGELVVGAAAGSGLLVLAAAPVLGAAGRSSAALVAVLGLHLLLRSRRSRSPALVLVDVLAGAGSLVLLGVTLVGTAPSAKGVAAPALLALVLVLTAVGPTTSVRRRRLGDLAETATLVAPLPLLLVATGVPGLVGG